MIYSLPVPVPLGPLPCAAVTIAIKIKSIIIEREERDRWRGDSNTGCLISSFPRLISKGASPEAEGRNGAANSCFRARCLPQASAGRWTS